MRDPLWQPYVWVAEKELKWYEFIAIWLDIRESKKQIRWVRQLNGDYYRKIEVTK